MSAFAALVLLCVASSCKDQNFDWDNVHAINYQQKFTDTFIKEFGQPAPGHQWGFDKPWVPSFTRSMTRGYIAKVESEYIPHLLTYGTAPNITDLEHKEVYEWFSTHKVTWSNTTSIVGYSASDKVQVQTVKYILTKACAETDNSKTWMNSYLTSDKVGQEVPAHVYNQLSPECQACVELQGQGDWTDVSGSADPYYNARVVKGDGTIIYGDIFFDGDSGRNKDGRIIKLVSGLGTKNEDGAEATAVATYPYLSSDNSIRTYSPDKVGNCSVGLVINFNSAWVQHVASESDILLPSPTEEKSATNGSTVNTKGQLNYLQFFDTDNNPLHTNDFNAEGGYGWGKQYPHEIKDDDTGKHYTFDFNGDLIFDADFSNTAIFNSLDSKLHDKWIIVYLKGDGYEGWYLGFDQEGAGNNSSTIVGANGYCNNWIIKLTAINEAKSTEPIRIMCEDLGGEANKVQIGDKVHISDIDYNDIVLDVTPDQTNRNITLTLRAAGGTIPLTVWYNYQPLFETHEMFQAGKTCKDNDHKSGIDYTIMYNTYGGNNATTTDGVAPKTYKLNLSEDFDINKLELKVWRFNAEEYQESAPNDFSDALWVNISNIAGQAPLKICVPQFVPWLKERCSIKDGYPDFVDWVKDPSELFWGTKDGIVESKIHSQYLVR